VKVRFLCLEEVLTLHADQIERYGGSTGVRDLGLLSSPARLRRPPSKESTCTAAAYLFHLAQNHPFIDGSKRAAAAAMFMFLFLNGHELDCTEDELRSASPRARTSKAAVAVFIATHCTPLH
jgi:death-on-curing protein